MTGELLRDTVLTLLGIFTATATPIAIALGHKLATYLEQKKIIARASEYREALEYAVPTAIAATEEWARRQVDKPSARAKFEQTAAHVRSIAPKAADAAGTALTAIIEGKVPIVRMSLADPALTAPTTRSLPPVDTTKLPRPPRVPA